MTERFISERIEPDPDSMDLADTPVGEPPLPRRFLWRGDAYAVEKVIERWKETGPDTTHGSKQHYLRKHWFRVRTTSGHEMKLYFERQAKSKAQRTTRWWLFTIVDNDAAPPETPEELTTD